MSEQQKTFYITTTLPYVNAELHMGHALEFIRADAIARYKKLAGYDVFFNTGTDEHGSKIYEKSQEAGLTPQQFVDQGFESFKKSLAIFGVTEDIHFIRTTDPHHIASAQAFWNKVKENGFIYKKNYQAKYCVGCESEKTDSDLNEAGECPDHPGRPLQIIEEENYFFKYSEFGSKLIEFYKQHPQFVIPEFRFNEVRAFVERGLQDFSISRLKSKMPWGIPVPGDDDHVMYVWFDALTNYINTLGWPDEEGDFRKYWVEGTPTQYCGKDNTRFQSAMWQAMLMAAGVPNSHQIVVNGFVMGEGGVKMSKTLGNVVNPREIVEEYGTDALRYFMLREISSFEDSPFSKERFKETYNANLANGIGNLTSRILTLSEKYLEACPDIPEQSIPQEFFDYLDKFEITAACDLIWDKIQKLDKKIQETEPFKVVKIDLEKGKQLITEMVLELYAIARMLYPIMPDTNDRLKTLIKANKKPETPLFARKD
ncbi:MAG: methionine--tRNA ligase [Candidatus Paceibacteria bacterium]